MYNTIDFYVACFVLLIIILPLVLIFTGNDSINTYGKKANNPILEMEVLEMSGVDSKTIPRGIKYAHVSRLWDLGYKGQGIKVGIIDSGVAVDHKEFSHNAVYKRNKIPDNFNGTNIHGTHVAGTIGAQGLKIIGAAPLCTVYDYRIFGNEDSKGKAAKLSGDVGLLIGALDQAYNDGCHIVNLSLGIPVDYAPIRNAIHKAYNKGMTVVAAAGNRERKSDNKSYPAMYDTVISVGALKIDGDKISKAAFSMDNSKVDVWAHGHRVLSTLPQQKYGFLSGTSMAAPLVTGAISSYFSQLVETGEKPSPQKAAQFLKENSNKMSSNTRVLKLKGVEVEWTE